MAPDAAERLVAAAQQYAIGHKPGLPRGLQTGTATVATLLCADPSDDLQAWFRNEPRHRYAAIRLPVLADPANQRLVWFTGRMSRGYIYARHLRDLIESVLAPSLGCEA
jgi:hypothetical protein